MPSQRLGLGTKIQQWGAWVIKLSSNLMTLESENSWDLIMKYHNFINWGIPSALINYQKSRWFWDRKFANMHDGPNHFVNPDHWFSSKSIHLYNEGNLSTVMIQNTNIQYLSASIQSTPKMNLRPWWPTHISDAERWCDDARWCYRWC